jgi:tetratricopeptide (TPR) repeat protein
MKLFTFISIIGVIVLTSCATGPRQPAINEIPEYGHQPKSAEMEKADQEFLAIAQKYPDAANQMLQKGWAFVQRGDLLSAVKRFNQAWLIDSTRWEIYWGFAVTEGKQEKFESCKHYYEKALRLGGDTKILNPEYAIVLREIAKKENNSEKLTEADNLFKSEIDAGNEKAACIYAYQLFRENRKDEVCQIMESSCTNDKDNLKQKAGCK